MLGIKLPNLLWPIGCVENSELGSGAFSRDACKYKDPLSEIMDKYFRKRLMTHRGLSGWAKTLRLWYASNVRAMRKFWRCKIRYRSVVGLMVSATITPSHRSPLWRQPVLQIDRTTFSWKYHNCSKIRRNDCLIYSKYVLFGRFHWVCYWIVAALHTITATNLGDNKSELHSRTGPTKNQVLLP